MGNLGLKNTFMGNLDRGKNNFKIYIFLNEKMKNSLHIIKIWKFCMDFALEKLEKSHKIQYAREIFFLPKTTKRARSVRKNF